MNYKFKFYFLLTLLIASTSFTSSAEETNSCLKEEKHISVRNMVQRLIGEEHRKFCFDSLKKHSGKDVFSIELIKDKVYLKGSSGVAIASALNKFLRDTKQGHFSWGGKRLSNIELPTSYTSVKMVSPVDLYYQFNFTAHGYTTPYWSWSEWEQELDLMAFNGITHPLIISGIEQVFLDTFVNFGYSETEIRDWLVLPAHLPWFLMGNMDTDGPILSKSLIANRAALGKKILARMNELGMSPVLPGYYGLVPRNFAEKSAMTDTRAVVSQGKWAGGYQRPALLNPNSKMFKAVAAKYYESLRNTFGKVDYFAADPFHEGGKTADINVTRAAQNIQSAMRELNPDATWVLQAWQVNPSAKILDAVSPDHSLVIDLWGDEDPAWDRDGKDSVAFNGVPWAWLAIQNFGGNTGLSGNLDTIVSQFTGLGVFNDPLQSNLVGLGLAMEGIEQNPVVLDLMFDMRWGNYNAKEFSVHHWVTDYAERRYGEANQEAAQAWRLLADSVYHSGPFRREGAIESVFAARPSLKANKASTWGPAYGPYYNQQKLEQALGHLINAGSSLLTEDTYRYDLVDVARQVLANRGRKVLQLADKAFQDKNVVAFSQYKNQFLQLILDQDALLQNHSSFSLLQWVSKATRFASSKEEAGQLEENAKRIVTTWAPIDSNLQDYSHREWSGLLKTYYYPRWFQWFEFKERELAGTSDVQKPDLWKFENTWVKSTEQSTAVINNNDQLLDLVKQLAMPVQQKIVVPAH